MSGFVAKPSQTASLEADQSVGFNKPLHLLQLIAAHLQATTPAARLW
jgi:hypothetical protein